MNKLINAFEDRTEKLLSIYFSAGYPQLNDTGQIMVALQKGGADLIEVGIPFSDPVADGEVIQRSSQKALTNGMSLKILFEQLKGIRSVTQIPLVMMGYLNPIYRYGFEKFCKECESIGIDGLIIPDLPANEVRGTYGNIMSMYNLVNIMLVSPNTSEERIQLIDELSTGFIYI